MTITVNDKTINEYTEPDSLSRSGNPSQHRLSSGTIALQGHDPKSKVYFKDIMVKMLPD